MRRRWSRRLPRRGPLRQSSAGRWIVVALGVAVLVTALVGAAEPYQQAREFRQVVACDREVDDCFGEEPASVIDRRTYTTTSTTTDANGHTSTTTTTHFELTWQRADGSRQTRDVSSNFYRLAEEGQPATLRLHRGEVVGLEVMGGAEWFLPESGKALGWWLYLAFFGLGALLWGLLFGWWDGFFMLGFRTFCWMFMGLLPVQVAAKVVAYGLDPRSGLLMELLPSVFFIAVAGSMLFGSLSRW